MKRLPSFLRLLSALLLVAPLGAWVYVAPFTNGDPLWQTNFAYGRDGILMPGGTTNSVVTTTSISFSNRTLMLRGLPQTSQTFYNTFFTGRNARFLSNFTASPTAPFGFSVIRTMAWINPWGNDPQSNVSQRSSINLWMVQENGISGEWQLYPAFAALFESQVVGNLASMTRSKWGIFSGVPQNLDLSVALRNDGTTMSLTNPSIHSLEWQHMTWRTGVGAQPAGWTNQFTNTNAIAILVTHDGSRVTYSLNPNPFDRNAYPNEFFQIGSTAVYFNTNIRVMLGQEVNYAYVQSSMADFSNFVIRSVTEETRLRVEPRTLEPGSETEIVLTLSPRFIEGNAGIAEAEISPPAGLRILDDSIRVEGDWGDGRNDGRRTAYRRVEGVPGTGAFRVLRTAEGMKLRLGHAPDSKEGLLDGETIDPVLVVRLRALPLGIFETTPLAVRVGNPPVGGWNRDRFATTGPQRAVDEGGGIRAQGTLASIRTPEGMP